MYLEGQATRPSGAVNRADAGFALAALLVAIAVLSVMLMVALPAWRHQSQREKEIELIFRGQQYARAIGLYRRKLAGAYPPSFDVLVEQKFLRRKYKDPITGDDFEPVFANSSAGQALMQQQGGAPAGGRVSVQETVRPDGRRQITTTFRSPGEGTSMQVQVQPAPLTGGRGRGSLPGSQLAGVAGGIVGVRSKSTGQSIILYNGRDRHDQWIFTYLAAQTQPGQTTGPGQRQGLPQRQSGPGTPPPGRGRGPDR